MKTCFLLFCVFHHFCVLAATVTAMTSSSSPGDWASGATWSSGTIPASGDLVIIPGGKAVVIQSQVYGSAPTLIVVVSGTLNFEPSGKLNLSALSSIQLGAGGKISPKNSASSQLITIGGVLKYSAANNGTLNGPAIADALSGLSVPGQPLSGFNPYTLPVSLDNFAAMEQPGRVIIRWQIPISYRGSHFELERSEDGGQHWKTVGSIPANSSGVYELEDRLVSTSPLYYRLQSWGENGERRCSPVLSFKRKVLASPVLYPNPTTGPLTLHLSDTLKGPLTLQLAGSSGAVLKQLQCAGGQPAFSLDIAALPKGLYWATITARGTPLYTQLILLK